MATSCRGPVWQNHTQGGQIFGLKHVRPEFYVHRLEAVAATSKKPGFAALPVRILVQYSHHCFSQSCEKVGVYDPDHLYTDESRGEARVFCPVRWDQSRGLPALVKGMMAGRCLFTPHHNYFVVDSTVIGDGVYTVYFSVTRHKTADLLLNVESAYCKDPEKPQGKIGFNAIVRNVLRGKQPKRPPV